MAACRRAGRQGGHCSQPLESALAEWAGKLALCSLLDALSMLLARPEPLFSSPTPSDPGSRGVTPHHPSQIHPLFHSHTRSHTRSHTLSHALSLCFSGLIHTMHPHPPPQPCSLAVHCGPRCAAQPTPSRPLFPMSRPGHCSIAAPPREFVLLCIAKSFRFCG
ncbi:hypothetical protein EDB80DRAFT_23867 [Ilyonectria destructans]|nr:hypothetical protein EDB80DRAFT_23867 [Ilyonectria destructans]